MNLTVLLLPISGALIGAYIGVWHGDRAEGDCSLAPIVDGFVGLVVGGLVGSVAAAKVAGAR